VEVAQPDVRLTYRKGYYGTPENTEAHYFAVKAPVAPVAEPAGKTMTATALMAASSGQAGLESETGAKATANPAAVVFNVQVVPGDVVTVSQPAGKGKEVKTALRELTLRFTMRASEFKVMASEEGRYAARLEVGGASYVEGRQASSNGNEVAVNFLSAEDPRIATYMVATTLTLKVPEQGRNRELYVSVRDVATGQSGSLVIPMAQVKMPVSKP